jgi:hypothetical protein
LQKFNKIGQNRIRSERNQEGFYKILAKMELIFITLGHVIANTLMTKGTSLPGIKRKLISSKTTVTEIKKIYYWK